MKKLLIVNILSVVAIAFSFGQVYTEDFTAETIGATSGAAAGTPGGTWSVTTIPPGTFSVQNVALIGKSFFVNDALTEGVWQSNVITLPSPQVVTISVELATGGTLATDYVRVYYKIDGGPEILFAELLGQLINATTTGSAYVAGTTLQIVMRGRDTQTGTLLGVPLGFTMDDLTITSVSALYSRKNSTWTDVTLGNGTWSTTSFTGASCNCTPTNAQVAVIGGGFTVTLPSNQSVGGVLVQNTGVFQYNTNNTTLTLQQGLFRVQSGGVVNSSSGAITGEQISFNAAVPGANFQIDAGGSATIENLIYAINASSLHYISGGGSLAITEDLLVQADNATLTNNMTSSVSVNDRLEFSAGVTNSTFINNGNLTAATLFFDEDVCSVTNNSTLTVNSITTGNNGDDDNVVTNSNGATLVVVTIDPNQADLDILNSGTINQTGGFGSATDIDAGDTNFDNLATGVWNWSFTPNTGYDADLNTTVNFTAVGNIFNYNGAGNQVIISATHHNVILSASGTKSAQSNLDFNGNILINGTAQLSVDAGDRNFALGGSWTVTSTNADPFVQGATTETVTFDGTGTQTISTLLGTETFRNLTLNKSSGNVILSSGTPTSATVSNVLTLTNGGLDINGQTLNITNGATTAITRTNGFIRSETTSVPYGRVSWTMATTTGAHLIPFGLASGAANYIPFTFNITVAGVGAAGTISVATYATATNNTPLPFGVDHVQAADGSDNSANTVDRFWLVTSGSYTTQPTARLTFTATTTEVGSITPLRAQLWDGSNWDAALAGQIVTATSAQLGSGITNYQQVWTMADNDSPLPVELTTFKAAQDGNRVRLYWKTASELNNDFFSIERLNTENDEFIPLKIVNGKGTTSEASIYEAFDEVPFAGKNYYRLKQTDFDGQFSYSKIEVVDFEGFDSDFAAYPSPSRNGFITVQAYYYSPFENISVQIISLTGVEEAAITLVADELGMAKATISTVTLQTGIYVVKAKGTKSFLRRVVIE
jgi:hypothetical protein